MKLRFFLLVFFCAVYHAMAQITIYTTGDSTIPNIPDPEENPEHGWVQMLPQFFADDIIIKNHAVNGRSSKSFRNEGRWQLVFDNLKPGDFVFIQFGHNDQKENDPKRFTNPISTYRNNLVRYIKRPGKKEAIPIPFISIVRRNFNESGVLIDALGLYPLHVRLVAQELEVPLVDFQYESELLELASGVDGSKKLHLHYGPSELSYYPDGKEDDTHLSVLGATEIATLAARQIELLNIPLRKIVKIEK